VIDLEDIIIALIAASGGFIGSLIGLISNRRLLEYKIEELTKKVEKHNTVIDRTYKLEEKTELQEEKIKAANHRIDDLERACVR
jgi:hypothetical protein